MLLFAGLRMSKPIENLHAAAEQRVNRAIGERVPRSSTVVAVNAVELKLLPVANLSACNSAARYCVALEAGTSGA
ncbi:hypothetical protein XH93_09275 [Bradyrhizobium sp. CCBAU 51753]|nr:hypothetical protein XH93_09275 [Bradyrhizobium sp. CCBAU 51753]